jgi:methylenetetrahydrofolate--tRNA-(uracil-5-)-methyltransferase
MNGKIGVMNSELIVIGGGLAGSEASWQAAERGVHVRLYEMRPAASTGAHTGPYLAELVCSNSLGSNQLDRASGLLKEELRRMDSMLLHCAAETAVPAGGALAVDREAFAQRVTDVIEKHPNIELFRREITEIPATPTIVASGPLTSPRLSQAVQALTGQQHLYFFDAIAPIVTLESLNFEIVYRASRYGKGEQDEGDYINCPMTRDEYAAFVDALINAERIELKEFEHELEAGVRAGMHHFFEGCLPVEILAQRGHEALAYGPLRPVGLRDPHTGHRPFAVVQLRQDNLTGTLYNLVGFQTNLTFSEQQRVLRMIPGLENAEFVRYGQMHRNTFIFSPGLLRPTLQFRSRNDLFFAGQIIGVEGYMGNIATGLLAGLNAARYIHGEDLIVLPSSTILGALCRYITEASPRDFQPMKANFGILSPYEGSLPRSKRLRNQLYAERSIADLETVLQKVRPINERDHLVSK